MSAQHYYELRTYSFVSAGHRGQFDEFMKKTVLPGYAKLGVGPVGAFTGVYGPNNATLFVLIPHESLDSAATAEDQLLKDESFLEAGRSVLGTDLRHPAYARYDKALLRAFSHMPQLELPENNLGRSSRIFEVRIYESHSRTAGKKKIEMFNEGGEIEIFRKTGLAPVLFGETVFGPRMPNLTYILTFDDMAHRDRAWDVFKTHPDWKSLSSDPQYAETVSTITDLILTPTAYSEI